MFPVFDLRCLLLTRYLGTGGGGAVSRSGGWVIAKGASLHDKRGLSSTHHYTTLCLCSITTEAMNFNSVLLSFSWLSSCWVFLALSPIEQRTSHTSPILLQCHLSAEIAATERISFTATMDAVDFGQRPSAKQLTDHRDADGRMASRFGPLDVQIVEIRVVGVCLQGSTEIPVHVEALLDLDGVQRTTGEGQPCASPNARCAACRPREWALVYFPLTPTCPHPIFARTPFHCPTLPIPAP